MKTILFSLLVLTILLTSCEREPVSGNGDIKTEQRSLDNFTGIRVAGANDVHIAYGPAFKVELKGSSNLLSVYETRVSNNILNLGYDNYNVRHDDIEVFITMPAIAQIDLSGSSEVEIAGNFPVQELLDVSISGSAEVEAESVFDCTNLLISISGSGDAELEKVRSRHSEIHISGSGSARLNTVESLKARISGSGKVYYTGNPMIDSQISGSGKLIHF